MIYKSLGENFDGKLTLLKHFYERNITILVASESDETSIQRLIMKVLFNDTILYETKSCVFGYKTECTFR